jgi:hypothetical protein
LTIAHWSAEARRDVEVFRVVDVDGLTPILMVLNEESERTKEPPQAKAPAGPIDGGSLGEPKPRIPYFPS